MIRHDDPADGARVDARSGEPFEISLPENPTTGYRWHVDRVDGLETAGDPQFEPGGSGVGAGGRRTFQLAGSQSGDAVISFSLRRPLDASGVQTRTITVAVR